MKIYPPRIIDDNLIVVQTIIRDSLSSFSFKELWRAIVFYNSFQVKTPVIKEVV